MKRLIASGVAAVAVGSFVIAPAAPSLAQETSNASHIRALDWSPPQPITRVDVSCPTNTVITGRDHVGGNDGTLRYQCSEVRWANWQVDVTPEAWGPWFSEGDGVQPYCEPNRALVGRQHDGGVDGRTRIRCGTLDFSSSGLVLGPLRWTFEGSSESGTLTCPTGAVMVGAQREHTDTANHACRDIQWDHERVPLVGHSVSAPVAENDSSFECASGRVLVSRQHRGDEYGSTSYECSALSLDGHEATEMSSIWTDGQPESQSQVRCRDSMFMTGRKHSGGPHGATSYKCTAFAAQGQRVTYSDQTTTSSTRIESSSDMTCPVGSAMIARSHEGGPDGATEYTCASPVMKGNQAVNFLVSLAIGKQVGMPALPGRQADRRTMGIDDAHFLHLDVGGEGWTSAYGVESGFRSAINVNDRTTHSQTGEQIANRLQVQPWSTSPGYPVADHTVDYVTMQGAPLTDTNIVEIARVLKDDGRVALWVDPDVTIEGVSVGERIERLANLVGGPVDRSCPDEFGGRAGNAKICLGD